MNIAMKFRKAGLTAFLVLIPAASGFAQNVLFTSAGSNKNPTGDGFTLGTEFTVDAANLEVTALGLLDTSGTGFSQSHAVGLFDHSEGDVEVASVTVPSGATATLLNGFRYINLDTPVTLNNADVYILGAYYPTPVADHLLDFFGGTNPGTNADFGNFKGVYSTSNSAGQLTEPTNVVGGPAYTGPNLEFTTGAPEPATWLMLVSAVGLLALVLRQKQHSA